MLKQPVKTLKDLIHVHATLDTAEMEKFVMVRDNLEIVSVIASKMFIIPLNVNYVLEINECLTISPCHANATCNNTEGSYMCSCITGYNGDGVTCHGMS